MLEILLMLLVPAAFTATFGKMVGRPRQGWALYAAMLAMFIGGAAVLYAAEVRGTPAQHAVGLHTRVVTGSAGGNLEGKEQRFGPAGSSLFVASGTASGDGAVNSGVESYTGLGAGVAMANMMTGEVIFGGPGSGLYGMIALVVLAVFVAGLMVGRTPEYLGKQIQAREIKLATIATVFVPLLVLGFAAFVVAAPVGRQSMLAHGPQGLAESVYAYLSQAQNNGSAMAGYTGFIQPAAGNLGSHGVTFADLAGGVVMTFGRFVPILALLALAGSLGPRRVAPPGLGTLRTDTPTFVIYLVGFVVDRRRADLPDRAGARAVRAGAERADARMRSDLVLVCDPSPQAQRALRVILRSARYEVVMTATGRDALDAVARERPQAVILELALPDFDGIEVLRRLRRRIEGPIIVLSAIDDTERKIAALTRGADDYITKPFSPGELLARLAARLRAAPSALRIEDNGLVIDLVAQRVTLDGEEVQLTATEFALLRVLATSRGTVSNRTLARKVWGMRRGDIGPRVRAHVANLRAKLDHPDRSSVIRNDIGLGYRFVGYAGTEADRSVPVTGDHDAGL